MESWEMWIKALHIIFVIAWMVGLLYLPRIFVYHSRSVKNSQESETFKIMERRILKAIMYPAMIFVWITGLYLAHYYGDFHSHWLQIKVLLVLTLTGFHGYLSRQVRIFRVDANKHSTLFFRVLNEVPTILMISIVVLVVVKPI
jgi:putative membrane protein